MAKISYGDGFDWQGAAFYRHYRIEFLDYLEAAEILKAMTGKIIEEDADRYDGTRTTIRAEDYCMREAIKRRSHIKQHYGVEWPLSDRWRCFLCGKTSSGRAWNDPEDGDKCNCAENISRVLFGDGGNHESMDS